jgi:hypothetical protein
MLAPHNCIARAAEAAAGDGAVITVIKCDCYCSGWLPAASTAASSDDAHPAAASAVFGPHVVLLTLCLVCVACCVAAGAGHATLTLLLLEKMLSNGPGRIVNVIRCVLVCADSVSA